MMRMATQAIPAMMAAASTLPGFRAEVTPAAAAAIAR
jgi:hypothetical protein